MNTYHKIILRLGFLFFGLVIFMSSCNEDRKPKNRQHVIRSFYHWKSGFDMSEEDGKRLEKLNIEKLYVRYFDVTWEPLNKIPIPVGVLSIQKMQSASTEIVPVVYIKNDVFLHLEHEDGDASQAVVDSAASENQMAEDMYYDYNRTPSNLANQVYSKISEMSSTCFGQPITIKEIQIDCDWNDGTRGRFFSFLKALQRDCNANKLKLSTTIRLHQVKYFKKTGVPPVDRGVLMFYNMGNITDLRCSNSIYNYTDAAKYLVNFDKYPLPLDVALPLFSWGVEFKQEKMTGIISIDKEILEDKRLHRSTGNLFKVSEPFIYKNYMLNKGDFLRLEYLDKQSTLEAAKQIEPYLRTDTLNVYLYDYNPTNFNNYSNDDLEEIYRYFD